MARPPEHIQDEQIAEFRDSGFSDELVRWHLAQCGFCRGRLADSVLLARAARRPEPTAPGRHLDKTDLDYFYRAAHEWEDRDAKWFLHAARHLLACDRCVEEYLVYARRYGPSANTMERALHTLRQAIAQPAGRLLIFVLPDRIGLSFVKSERAAPMGSADLRRPDTDGRPGAPRDMGPIAAPPLRETTFFAPDRAEDLFPAPASEMPEQVRFALDEVDVAMNATLNSIAVVLTERGSGQPVNGARVVAFIGFGGDAVEALRDEAVTDASGSARLPCRRLRRIGIWCRGRNWEIDVTITDPQEQARERERAEQALRRRVEEEAAQRAAMQKAEEERRAARMAHDAERTARQRRRLLALEQRARLLLEFRSLDPLDQLRRIATDDRAIGSFYDLFPAIDEVLLARIDRDLAQRLIARLKSAHKGKLADIRERLIERFGDADA